MANGRSLRSRIGALIAMATCTCALGGSVGAQTPPNTIATSASASDPQLRAIQQEATRASADARDALIKATAAEARGQQAIELASKSTTSWISLATSIVACLVSAAGFFRAWLTDRRVLSEPRLRAFWKAHSENLRTHVGDTRTWLLGFDRKLDETGEWTEVSWPYWRSYRLPDPGNDLAADRALRRAFKNYRSSVLALTQRLKELNELVYLGTGAFFVWMKTLGLVRALTSTDVEGSAEADRIDESDRQEAQRITRLIEKYLPEYSKSSRSQQTPFTLGDLKKDPVFLQDVRDRFSRLVASADAAERATTALENVLADRGRIYDDLLQKSDRLG